MSQESAADRSGDWRDVHRCDGTVAVVGMEAASSRSWAYSSMFSELASAKSIHHRKLAKGLREVAEPPVVGKDIALADVHRIAQIDGFFVFLKRVDNVPWRILNKRCGIALAATSTMCSARRCTDFRENQRVVSRPVPSRPTRGIQPSSQRLELAFLRAEPLAGRVGSCLCNHYARRPMLESCIWPLLFGVVTIMAPSFYFWLSAEQCP